MIKWLGSEFAWLINMFFKRGFKTNLFVWMEYACPAPKPNTRKKNTTVVNFFLARVFSQCFLSPF